MKKSLSSNRNQSQIARIFTVLLVLLSFAKSNGQLSVSTTPQKKNFLIERGSGIACCSCPGITDKCMVIVNSYPKSKGIFMVYHFGPDARPQSGQLNKDYKTKFGDSIMTPTWPFYLNMMVNRKDRGVPYGSTFIFGPNNDQVTPECATTAEEIAPVNLAMSSGYNATTREITVDAKAYYTSNSATSNNYLQIAIVEDSIVGPQCVGSNWDYKYLHMDMFRANMNGFSGALITTTTKGTTISETYKYTVPAKYGTEPNTTSWVTPNVKNFKLIMFMTEDLNGNNTKFGRIQNVITIVLGASSSASVKDNLASNNEVTIYPNPVKGVFTLNLTLAGSTSMEVVDLIGKTVYNHQKITSPSTTVDLSNLKKGFYNLIIKSDRGTSVKKILLTD